MGIVFLKDNTTGKASLVDKSNVNYWSDDTIELVIPNSFEFSDDQNHSGMVYLDNFHGTRSNSFNFTFLNSQ